MGLSGRQVVLQAELPLAAPLLMTGVRTAAVQVVATATLAALVAGGGLGRIINLGFGQQDYGVVLAGALLVAVLAVLTELVLSALSWTLTPGEKRLPILRTRAARRAPDAAVPL
jgi:osmoprotectant transport system permease protein